MINNKTDFFAMVCHELRNPISAVLGCVDALKSDSISKNEHDEFLKIIETSGSEAMHLIQDLMDVAKYNSQNFSVNLSNKIDICEIVLRSINIKKYEAIERKIKIINKISSKNIDSINLDPQRMKQIFVNLISNSIKYSPDNTSIVIDGKSENGRLEIDVIDEGFGMTQEEVESSVQKYTTIKTPNSNRVDAFGLGLPLVKELVELQKGEMKIFSKKNEGTRINLSFRY